MDVCERELANDLFMGTREEVLVVGTVAATSTGRVVIIVESRVESENVDRHLT